MNLLPLARSDFSCRYILLSTKYLLLSFLFHWKWLSNVLASFFCLFNVQLHFGAYDIYHSYTLHRINVIIFFFLNMLVIVHFALLLKMWTQEINSHFGFICSCFSDRYISHIKQCVWICANIYGSERHKYNIYVYLYESMTSIMRKIHSKSKTAKGNMTSKNGTHHLHDNSSMRMNWF